jgi:hypothetical protein
MLELTAVGHLSKRTRLLAWLALSVVCLFVDFETGPIIEFPLVYLVPISLAAWFNGRVWGLVLAVVLPLCRLYFRTVWEPPWTFFESSINAVIRITVFSAFAWLIDRTAGQMRALQHTRLLEGMLGVCSVCKNIREKDSNVWTPLESYVEAHPDDFEPDVCPDCGTRVRDVFDRR